MSVPAATPWPSTVFHAPVLRGLDQAGRERIMAAGRLAGVPAGTTFYQQQDTGDSFFVVTAGSVALSAVRRGAEAATVVRIARLGETFGEEATLPGRARRMTATAVEPTQVAEIPVQVYRRAVGRSGAAVADQEQRFLRRRATQDLLRTLAFTAELSEDDIGLVLDAITYETFSRGDRIYGVGDIAHRFYLIASGLVQLQTEEEDRIHVQAYLSGGDFFGDEELLRGEPRQVGAVAMGECHLMSMSADALRLLADRNPGLLGRIRRLAVDRQAQQLQVVGGAAANATRHVFHDLYRMQMARSMLTIDQDACVRCGHCAWSCASLYGVARLVRRGDKVVTRIGTKPSDERHLMIPNSCQHCRNPVCMIDCPTGAIGRDPRGEVFIREELCTGCGSCAKACPWENIRMGPRTPGARIAESLAPAAGTRSGHALFPEVAVKCDLCRTYEAPACVQACPTAAIARLEPTQDFAEVASLLGTGGGSEAARRRGPGAMLSVAAALLVGSAASVLGWGLHAQGALAASTGPGYWAGWLALTLMLGLAAYAIPKRFVRLWMKKRRRSPALQLLGAEGQMAEVGRVRSAVRPFYVLHVALGLVVVGAVAAHSGLRVSASSGGALALAFWLTVGLGIVGALAYDVLPRRLSRIERVGALPEDLGPERRHLVDRLYRCLSGRSDLVKRIAERLLIPYAHSPAGSLALLLSGRGLRQEEQRLRHAVDRALQGRGVGKLAGLDDVVRIAVEMRALPLRRLLTASLRGWLPIHIIATGITLTLLVVHVVSASWTTS
ncbi:MAG: cyclic nucleotide-binding domain-containing protein [Myxococcales bacterium]|nr:cyclic nucleotide-binding domain-containing protein [Myxococcales bacterium]